MENQIKPSKFYFVRNSTSLKQCLTLMQEKNLSYLLVEDHNDQLVGIFTLKDMVKVLKYILYGEHLDKPVNVAMTRPVLTIPSHKLHKATKIMLKNKIRHLPITSDKPGEESRVIGVVDMESLLLASLHDEKKKKYKIKDISVFSPTGALQRFLKNVLNKYDHLQIDKLWASKLRSASQIESHVNNYDLFFFDLVDEKALKLSLVYAEEINNAKKRMLALVTPGQFVSEENKKLLKRLSKISRVRVYEKPINVHDIIFECLS